MFNKKRWFYFDFPLTSLKSKSGFYTVKTLIFVVLNVFIYLNHQNSSIHQQSIRKVSYIFSKLIVDARLKFFDIVVFFVTVDIVLFSVFVS